jgi:hypothetical protein
MDDLIPPLSHAPDGLYESDVDALIAEYFTADALPESSSMLVDRVAEHRHMRRVARRVISVALQSARTDSSDTGDADAA